ncbi:MAG: SRPBCC domain-containing protein [Candidatus Korobacteraceae bacterium]|jgi:carbon monoxide dehydrogenase subunit G
MALQSADDVIVEVDRATAFSLVENPQRMAECIPGCHDLQEIAPGKFTAVLTNKVSFITLNFKVLVEVVGIDTPNSIEAKITGEPIGLGGRLMASAGLKFSDAGENRTLIHYSADVGLTGKLGGLGQPVFRAKSATLGKEFAANLKAAIEKPAIPSSMPATFATGESKAADESSEAVAVSAETVGTDASNSIEAKIAGEPAGASGELAETAAIGSSGEVPASPSCVLANSVAGESKAADANSEAVAGNEEVKK